MEAASFLGDCEGLVTCTLRLLFVTASTHLFSAWGGIILGALQLRHVGVNIADKQVYLLLSTE